MTKKILDNILLTSYYLGDVSCEFINERDFFDIGLKYVIVYFFLGKKFIWLIITIYMFILNIDSRIDRTMTIIKLYPIVIK